MPTCELPGKRWKAAGKIVADVLTSGSLHVGLATRDLGEICGTPERRSLRKNIYYQRSRAKVIAAPR